MNNLTYAEVGATENGPLPRGYRHLRYRTPIGAGQELMRRAGGAILDFRMHRAAGVRITASASHAAPGVRVTSGLGVGPLRLVVPCEVIWAHDEERRAGFGYGTLPGHVATGEEAFTVELDDSGVAWFVVTAFSRPARWPMHAAGPLGPIFQRAYAQWCGRALRRLASSHR